MLYKIELKTCQNAPIPGVMRTVVEASDLDMAVIEARKNAGIYYQMMAKGQHFTDAEIADRDAATQRFLAFRDPTFPQEPILG